MRKSGKWMSIWDERILEYLSTNESGSPTEIANNEYIHVTKQHISRRLKELSDHGLIESLGNGIYKITNKGTSYLLGNYDAESEYSYEKETEQAVFDQFITDSLINRILFDNENLDVSRYEIDEKGEKMEVKIEIGNNTDVESTG